MDATHQMGVLSVLIVVGLYGLVNSEEYRFTLTGRGVIKELNCPGPQCLSKDVTWHLAGPEGSRLELHCSEISLPKIIGCTEGALIIKDGQNQLQVCRRILGYRRQSVGSWMSVQLKRFVVTLGRIRCTVRLATGTRTVLGPRTSCPCGMWNAERRRIIGGEETGRNEYPFMAYLTLWGHLNPLCGASILTERHILTATHCVIQYNVDCIQVVVGAHNTQTDVGNGRGQIINVKEKHTHELYDRATNDIALLELAATITFGPSVGRICLPTQVYHHPGQDVIALGWGGLRLKGKLSPTLQKVSLQVVDLGRCKEDYNDTFTIALQNPTQFCTFSPNKATTNGDSGGPLIYWDSELQSYIQVGITSYGQKGSNVNTDVLKYFNWIQRNIDQQSQGAAQYSTCEKLELLL